MEDTCAQYDLGNDINGRMITLIRYIHANGMETFEIYAVSQNSREYSHMLTGLTLENIQSLADIVVEEYLKSKGMTLSVKRKYDRANHHRRRPGGATEIGDRQRRYMRHIAALLQFAGLWARWADRP